MYIVAKDIVKSDSMFHFAAVPDGYVQVGKIVYNPKEVLGHGCEGTFVYK